ncbi:MAG: T9SS type A sorting domain-containing protein [Chitinophagaceae bacterium]|nr:T9SS type A sorting domain-containing protein [Chitinophagaceae bacterium]MBK7680421.1 T9SS type A sorting domain-containing protein [Chitinophagaceae bacterium]MBK8301853.1 T9SS type A sorting domain-containing protein [Chitinophagaceae bacterium]MBK9381595.1 T9SS type A sorting domain-containing protein [Chitinophagaceae bacterium]MBK9661340.1 T9SS type A sorting domain-containing protein [Chitinophagaceae bacterium]
MKNLYKSSSHVFNVSHLTPPQLFDSQCFGNFIFKNNFVSAIKKKALLPILLLVVTLFCSNILNAQTYNLNWGSTSWVGPTYSKTVTNIGGSGIDATVVITNTSPAGNVSAPGAAANDAFQNNSPIVGATGGVNWFLPGTTAGSPLVQWVNWNTLTSTVITVITFTRPVNGVSFYVGDMDRTSPLTYVDRITITGKNGTVAVPNPIVTKFQATATGPDTVLISGNSAFGNSTFNANAATNSITTQGATVYVQFGNPVTEITILWDQGPGATGNPAGQAIAIGDIAFTKVIPEYPPTADNFLNTPMLQGNAATAIPGLTASDLDGTVASYKITTVPSAAQGVLSIPCPPTPTGATCTGGFADLTAAVLAANPGGIVLTPTQAAAMRFDPAPNFTGNASFTFNATDNDGNISNTATYTLPVIALPPVSNNIMENSMPNTNGPTAIQGLNSSDVDGTISTYQLTTLPPTVQGVLSVPCPPTLTGATCTGGFQDLTAAILSGYPSGIPLTATQMAGMRFDPAIGFIGNATFNYNAVDNSGNTSNTANYTIPVTASATTARPPLADNITSQSINNSLGNTAIPSLSATDLDGTVASYTIGSIPPVGQGVLRVSCPSTPAGTTCTGGFAALNAGTVLTPAEAARLFFDPAPGFTGTASFTYTATDNTGSVSNIATYNLPIANTPPTATNINTFVPFNAGPTVIPVLSGSDADGTIASFNITTVPTATQGVLSVPCPPTPTGGTCTGGFVSLTPAVLAANPGGIVLTPAQAAAIRFDPATGFSGTAPFNYTTTDNSGNVSNTASYNITMAPQPPVTGDIVNTVMPNTNGVTAVTALSGTDADGTIASYTLLSVPDASQGVLSVPCPPTPTGGTCTGGFVNLTAAVLAANLNGISLTPAQAAALRFDPTAGFTGLAAFKYAAVDNSGLQSNVSTYTLPVSGTGNIPPVARNILTPSMTNTNGPTAVPSLLGTDADGTIASYTLISVPQAAQGVLSIPCPPTPTGATCTGGFADLTPAVLAANPAGIVLTPTQAAGMRFDPAPNFAGNVEFAYTTIDNSGASSAGAVYTIPVTSLPPVANAVVAPAMPQTNGPTTIPGLIAADADGTIASYQIESLPLTSQGVLSVPCPPTLTGATCTGGFQDLTAAVLANYITGGIPLTPTQMAGMRFDPAPGYQGEVIFNYHATDNSGIISNSTTYTIPVTGLPPLSNDVVAPKMFNTNGPTTIPGLNSADADGTISSYRITSVPPTSQGVISIPCPPTPTGATCSGGFADLTAAVLAANPGGIALTPTQAAGLRLDPAAGYSGNVTFNYAAYDNTGNLSNVAAYTIPVGTPFTLPLTLISFNAIRNGNDINVSWRAEAEINVSRYEVEYSTNGSAYSTGGMVPARNLSVNNYQFTLINYTQPVYYLRLKMIDQDGRFVYSSVVVVRMSGGKNQISIYPNPAVDFVNAELGSNARGNYSIQLTDAAGRTVNIKTITNAQPNQLITMQRNGLASGVYVLKIVSSHYNETTLTKVVFK